MAVNMSEILSKDTRNEFRKVVVQIPDASSIVRDNAIALLDTCDALEGRVKTLEALRQSDKEFISELQAEINSLRRN
jgi:hypothetical protein